MAKTDDSLRRCISGIRHTIEAVRRHEDARRGMIHSPTVFLLGVDAAVCHALEDLLRPSGCVTEQHRSTGTFLDTYDPERPGCIVLDMTLLASDGFVLQQKLSASRLVLPIIILVGEEPLPSISRGFAFGPVDFLRKPVDVSELQRAVTIAIARDQEARCRADLIAELHQRAAQLSEQERQVMGLLAKGLVHKQIAARLGISVRTVQLRRTCVMRKMQTRSLAELVQFALILEKPATAGHEPPASEGVPTQAASS
jgi:two-component system, LuxR family, response regulator FixJ